MLSYRLCSPIRASHSRLSRLVLSNGNIRHSPLIVSILDPAIPLDTLAHANCIALNSRCRVRYRMELCPQIKLQSYLNSWHKAVATRWQNQSP